MPRPRVALAATTFVVVATGLALAAPAQAAPAGYAPLFQATGAGTAVSLVGGAVSSSPTAPSAVRTRSTTQRVTLSAATVDVPGVLHVGAASTDASTARKQTEAATVVTGHAQTSGVDLLNGILSVDAVSTTASVTVRAKSVTAKANTTFVNLKIAGRATINGTVAANTTIELPGVARIVLNQLGTVSGTTSGMAVATGIAVTLLGDTVAGSTIIVNPTSAQTALVGPGYAPLTGYALGAQVTVTGDSSLSVGPLGAIGMPDVGTNKQTLTNSVAAADLGAVGGAGAFSTTANGAVTNSGSRSTMHSHVTDVSLLGGLITADSLDADAQVLFRGTSAPVTTASVSFTGLAVAGVPVPLDAAPGLVLPLPGLGAVAIRATATTATAAAAAGLTVNLTTAAFGLPAGATIQIGFAYAGLLDI